MGDLLGLKGHLVNFVVRKVKKLVPAWSLPGHVSFKAALASGQGKTMTPANSKPDDVAFLQYTGGTTGVSKGAMLLNSNVLANAEQNNMWLPAAYINKPKPDRLLKCFIGSKVTAILVNGGFYLVVELHREGSMFAACTACLFYY